MPESLTAGADAGGTHQVNNHFEPRWLRAVAFGAAAAVSSFGAVGVTLAIAGVYRPWLAFALGAIGWVGLLALARPILVAPGATARSAHVAAAGGVVFVGAIALWHAAHSSQHVLINRDGGAYANAGRWIARAGNLHVLAAVGPFAHHAGLQFGSNAMYQARDGSLSFQFAHLLPAVLAEARSLGGDRLMFATPGLLAGVALLAFFVAAWRLLRNPYVALAALVTFAFVMPEVSFSRDTYSELPMQIFLFSALWILADRRALRRPRVALVAGVLLGLLQATRIDAIAVLIGLPPLFAITWILAEARNRRSVAASAAACAIGVIPGFVLGFTDVSLRASQYLHDLRGNVKQLVAAMVASVVVSLVAVAVALLIARFRGRVPRVDVAGWVLAGLVIVLGFGAWLVRPHVQHVRGKPVPLIGGLQEAAGATVDPMRTYGERSIVWMSWYLGPVTLVAAIVGAALLARSLVRGQMRFALAGLALLGPTSALYLWRPSAVPDHIWVTRRYLFSAFPLLTLLAFGLVAVLARATPRRVPRALPVAIAIAIGAGAVVYPVSTVAPLRNMTEQRGDLGIIKDACGILGAHAAVVVLQRRPTGSLNVQVPQALRGWCGTPVAVVATGAEATQSNLAQLAAAWSASGRTLWVVADERRTITAVLPSASVVSTPVAVSPYFLERTLLRRPSQYLTTHFSMVLARVPTR